MDRFMVRVSVRVRVRVSVRVRVRVRVHPQNHVIKAQTLQSALQFHECLGSRCGSGYTSAWVHGVGQGIRVPGFKVWVRVYECLGSRCGSGISVIVKSV